MLAPLKILEHLSERLVEILRELPLPPCERAARPPCPTPPADGELLSVVLPLPRVPASAPQLSGQQFQFVRQTDGRIQAGYGCAAEWQAEGADRLPALQRAVGDLVARWQRHDPDATGFDGFAMLGFAAADDSAEQVEDHLPGALLWVPEIGLCVRQGEAALVLSAQLPAARAELQQRWLAALTRLVPALYPEPPGALPAAPPMPEFAEPDLPHWRALVDTALAEIGREQFEKVVLCRRVDLRGTRAFDIGRLLGALGCLYPSCQLINLRRRGKSFVSASPERLLSLQGRHLMVDALAGTAPRGATEQEDRYLGELLGRSGKNLREHRHVIDAITASLAEHCTAIEAPARPAIMRLTNVQHLWSPITATTRPDVNVFQLAERLHPTPATNGQPRTAARAWIDRHEPIIRGWYTGAAGVVAPDLTGELWVLLRCARLCADHAELYAGAGIVEGSDPLLEWDETENKLAAMLSALQYA